MEKTTQVRVTIRTAAILREIAAGFGYYQRRGVLAGETGNVSEMLETLARRYEENPAAVLVALGPLVAQVEARERQLT